MALTTLNIGAQSQMRGSLKFTGANDIGPNIVMTLTLVQLAPATALNVIGDEYGIIEIEGEVLIVAGSFGTVTHPDDTIVAPDINSYYVGTGVLEWQPEGATTFDKLGNCQSCEFTQTITRLDHWEHMTGIRSKDFAPVVQQAATVRMRLDEWNAYNLRLYFLSD